MDLFWGAEEKKDYFWEDVFSLSFTEKRRDAQLLSFYV